MRGTPVHCCMEYHKNRSFCIRQTFLNSLKISNCIRFPTSTRMTFRYVVSVHLPRPQTSNSASQLVSTVCLSGCKRTDCSWMQPKRNSCGVRHLGSKTACQTRHFASALCSRLDVCATSESISTATFLFPCVPTSREPWRTAFLLSDSFEAFGGASASMYTVNHKKRDILFLTITLANLNRFS